MKSLTKLLANPINVDYPLEELQEILLAVIELLSLEENDFSWSGWESKDDAIIEVKNILEQVESKQIPPRLTVSILFAPTAPLQEVSISSGWADTYLKVAQRFDTIEELIWKMNQPHKLSTIMNKFEPTMIRLKMKAKLSKNNKS